MTDQSNGSEGVVAMPEAIRGEWTPRRCLHLGQAAEIEALCKFLNDAQAPQSAGADDARDAARYRWLREERDEQQPVVTLATFSDWGPAWRDVPLWGDELDAKVDDAMKSSPSGATDEPAAAHKPTCPPAP